MPRPRTIALAALLAVATSCAAIQFERGPYAIRDLEVIYSDQEDVTFLSWRLRGDALLNRVEFEIWAEDMYLPIDLGDTLFPAEPERCGEHWCFQYQVAGEYELPAEGSPLRSIHEDDGVFMGPAERFRRVQRTFDIDPLGLGHNEEIDPGRFDWFAENEVFLRRDYEWQFTAVTNGCEAPDESAWAPMGNPVEVDHIWTDQAVTTGICFSARPDRRDVGGIVRQDFLVPSAETTWEEQAYVPPKVASPIVWGLMLDLEIPNESRCSQVKGRLIDIIERAIAARGDSVKLGIYTPTDPETGDELGGCDQASERDYPLERMLRDAATAKAEAQPEEIRVMWIFANNIELPPSERILEQLELFGFALLVGEAGGEGPVPFPDDETDLLENSTRAYTWAIGSNVFMGLFPWDTTTPWRPVEDQTLAADVKAVAKSTLPFLTMRHVDETQVDLRPPARADARPLYFKVCDSTPDPVEAIGIEPGGAYFQMGDTIPWPEFDDTLPYYLVFLEPQLLVPRSKYVRRREEVVVEVCTAFCDGPFRTRGGDDFAGWRSRGNCQWQR